MNYNSYKTAKELLKNKNPDISIDELNKYIEKHKLIKDYLLPEEKQSEFSNIDQFIKSQNYNFDNIKKEIDRYPNELISKTLNKILTKDDLIIAHNSNWIIYKINTAEQARLFKDFKNSWCLSGSPDNYLTAYENFYRYSHGDKSSFYFARRVNLKNDKYDFIAIQVKQNKEIWYDLEDDIIDPNIVNQLKSQFPDFEKEKFKFYIPETWSLYKDNRYNVNGSVEITTDMVENSKLKYKFYKVKGNFTININDLSKIKFNSLEGFPYYITGDLNLDYANIDSLENLDTKVVNNFNLSNTKIKSLKGISNISIENNFIINNNELQSLEGCPSEIGNIFTIDVRKIFNIDNIYRYLPKCLKLNITISKSQDLDKSILYKKYGIENVKILTLN